MDIKTRITKQHYFVVFPDGVSAAKLSSAFGISRMRVQMWLSTGRVPEWIKLDGGRMLNVIKMLKQIPLQQVKR